MIESTLPDSVASLFRVLIERHNFSICSPERSGAFDQMMQTIESPDMSVRFVRDRGDEFLEIGGGDAWFSPDLVRCMLLGARPDRDHLTIDQASSFLHQHICEIVCAFSPENRHATIERLRECRAEKIRRMFPTE